MPFGVFCEIFGTRRAEKTTKKHASRSHAKTGLFVPLENDVLPAWELTLAHYWGKIAFSFLLKTRFYLHGSSICRNSYFYVNFLFFESTLEIAVLLAWELNSDEINSNVYDFFVFLWFPEKVSFCFSPFFKFYYILGSFWEASGVLLVTFGILRGVLGLVWAVFGCLSESFVRLLGPTLENFQSKKRASRSIAKTGFFRPLENDVLPAWELTLAHYWRNIAFPFLLKTRFYLYGSSICRNSYFYVNFLFFESTLEIAVLLAWELNSDEINSNVYDFFVFLWFPEKVSFCFSPFFKFYYILGSFWEASGVLLVTFGILRGVLGLVWAVFGCLSESFVRLLGPTLENFQSKKRASRSIAKTGLFSMVFSVCFFRSFLDRFWKGFFPFLLWFREVLRVPREVILATFLNKICFLVNSWDRPF